MRSRSSAAPLASEKRKRRPWFRWSWFRWSRGEPIPCRFAPGQENGSSAKLGSRSLDICQSVSLERLCSDERPPSDGSAPVHPVVIVSCDTVIVSNVRRARTSAPRGGPSLRERPPTRSRGALMLARRAAGGRTGGAATRTLVGRHGVSAPRNSCPHWMQSDVAWPGGRNTACPRQTSGRPWAGGGFKVAPEPQYRPLGRGKPAAGPRCPPA